MLKQLLSAGMLLSACPQALADAQASPKPHLSRSFNLVLQSVTLDDLRMLLDDMGATFVAAGRNNEGAPFVFGALPDGLTFGAYTVCAKPDGTECRGLEFMAVYSSKASIQDISRIDQDYAAVSVYKPDDKTVHISRYVILDNGVTWGNLIENSRVFDSLCAIVHERLTRLDQAQGQ